MNEKVSILVCAYNAQRTICECVRSAVEQSYDNLEVIVVNDGSTDKTANLLNMLKKQYPQLMILHKENGGIAEARNTALNLAKGEWIFFADSDDVMSQGAIELMIKKSKQFHSDLVIGAHLVKGNYFSYRIGVKREGVITPYLAMKELLKDQHIKNYVWAKLIRREIFQNLKFNEGRVFEDVQIMAPLFHNAKRIIAIPDIVYKYTVGKEGSISNGLKPQVLMDMILAFERQNSFILARYPKLKKESNQNLNRCYLMVKLSCFLHHHYSSRAYHMTVSHQQLLKHCSFTYSAPL